MNKKYPKCFFRDNVGEWTHLHSVLVKSILLSWLISGPSFSLSLTSLSKQKTMNDPLISYLTLKKFAFSNPW